MQNEIILSSPDLINWNTFKRELNPGPASFTGEFYETFKDLNQSFTNSSQKVEEEGTLPNSFYEISLP